MEPYLYHGIRDFNLDILINILKSGFILRRCNLKQEYNLKNNNEIDFNGENYISLSQKSIYDPYYGNTKLSSFDRFIYNHPCLVIKNNYRNLIYPNFLDLDMHDKESINKLLNNKNSERYSCFLDEVQSSTDIEIKDFLAIGYPTKHFQYRRNIEQDIELIKEILKVKKVDIPIVDSSYYDFADNNEKIKKYML